MNFQVKAQSVNHHHKEWEFRLNFEMLLLHCKEKQKKNIKTEQGKYQLVSLPNVVQGKKHQLIAIISEIINILE